MNAAMRYLSRAWAWGRGLFVGDELADQQRSQRRSTGADSR